jgi:Isochorismatase family
MPGYGGQTKFTADGTLTVTHRLQCFPFPPATRCRRGEWGKLLRCLISLENIFVLSIRRHKPCQPKACDHRHHLFRVYCPNGQPFLLPTSNVLIAQTSDRQSSTSACSPTSVAAAACHGHGSSHHQPVQRTGKLATTVALEQELRSRGIDTVVLTGVSTNGGVESTLRQGTGLAFGFVVVEDACSGQDVEEHRFAFERIFPRLARVRTVEEVLKALA